MPHRKTPRPVPFKVGRSVGRPARGYEDNTIPLPTPPGDNILLESGDALLLESGFNLLQEKTY